MGFEWSDPAVRIEIFGASYEVEIGDPYTIGRLQEASAKLQKFDVEKAGKEAAVAMSSEMRGVVRAVIGDEAAEKVFEGRKPNLAMEASMIAYIFEQIAGASARAGAAMSDSVSRIAALSKPIGDEE